MSEIVRIGARGDGVSTDGRHVPFGVPGDTLDDSGTVIPGEHQVPPPCRHFPDCGGCQLQHADDAVYTDYLGDRVAQALLAQRLTAGTVRPAILSPPKSRRRATLQAEKRGLRIVLGFNQAGSHSIVDMHECHVLMPALFALVSPLRRLLARIVPDRGRVRVGLTVIDQGVDMLLSGFAAEGLEAVEALTAFGVSAGLARLSVDEGYGSSPRYQPGSATITLSGTPVTFPEGAFLQATGEGEGALVAAVGEALVGSRTVADLFAGLGTFALSLSARVHAVEGSRDAALSLKATGRTGVEHRDLFRNPLTTGELAPFDGLVLDPPRAGALEQVRLLAASAIPRIAYVSCNPATFARDARALVDGGYRLEWVQPVGQFRWSTHVELVAAFTKAR